MESVEVVEAKVVVVDWKATSAKMLVCEAEMCTSTTTALASTTCIDSIKMLVCKAERCTSKVELMF